jgi:hypothetical protein
MAAVLTICPAPINLKGDSRISELVASHVEMVIGNPYVLDPADGRLEQDTENQEGCAIPVIIDRRQFPIWKFIGYID